MILLKKLYLFIDVEWIQTLILTHVIFRILLLYHAVKVHSWYTFDLMYYMYI